ncbi:uncharacterized protein LOC141532794 [Cotesia typhae]|uniref:uncharacterized protein LOC141532794 n=1 Tax=Cotesia typhae TaxID=2053667 RepID=UPI003D684196
MPLKLNWITTITEQQRSGDCHMVTLNRLRNLTPGQTSQGGDHLSLSFRLDWKTTAIIQTDQSCCWTQMSVQLPATDIVHVRKLTPEGLRIGTIRSGTRSLQFLLYLEVLKRKSGTERLEMIRSKFQRQMILVVAITITCINIIIMYTETMSNVIAGPGRVHEEKLVDTFQPVDEAMRTKTQHSLAAYPGVDLGRLKTAPIDLAREAGTAVQATTDTPQ